MGAAMQPKEIFVSILIVAGATVLATGARATPSITIEVVNRFRLLNGEAEERRFYRDLEQRLICGDYQKKRNQKYRNYCSDLDAYSGKPGRENFQILWNPSTLNFEKSLVHDLRRLVRFSVVDLPSRFAGSCSWKINDQSIEETSCSTPKPKEITLGDRRSSQIKIAVQIAYNDGRKEVAVEKVESIRDVIFVTLGDSYISGEGNPHRAQRVAIPGDPDMSTGKRAEWLDLRCHRSLFTGAAIAAYWLAKRVPTQSVSLLPLACSGAEVNDGVLTAYYGRETEQQASWAEPDFDSLPDELYSTQRKLPPQISLLYRTLCPNATNTSLTGCTGLDKDKHLRPDLIVISVGGNDVGFGSIVSELAHGNQPGVVDIPKILAPAYEALGSAVGAIEPLNTFMLAYLNPTQYVSEGKMRYCDDINGHRGNKTFVPKFAKLFGLGVTEKGAEFAHKKVLLPLNETLRKFAASQNWDVVSIPSDIQDGHGYCNRYQSWFYNYSESLKFQGMVGIDYDEDHNNDIIGDVPSGALHPNIFGHFNMATEIYRHIQRTGLVAP